LDLIPDIELLDAVRTANQLRHLRQFDATEAIKERHLKALEVLELEMEAWRERKAAESVRRQYYEKKRDKVEEKKIARRRVSRTQCQKSSKITRELLVSNLFSVDFRIQKTLRYFETSYLPIYAL